MQCVDTKVGLFYATLALRGGSAPGGNSLPNNFSNGAMELFSSRMRESKRAVISYSVLCRNSVLIHSGDFLPGWQ